jgi:hypothetical protein
MSIVLLSILIVSGSMGAMVLGVVLVGRPLGGGCAGVAGECEKPIACEGCPRSRAGLRSSPFQEEQS